MASELGLIRTDSGRFVDKGNLGFDPRHPDFAGGADPLGVRDSYHALSDCDAAAVLAGGCVRPGIGDFLINTSLTFSAGMALAPGVILKPASGVTITVAGRLEAGRYQIFDLSAGGTVTFAAGTKTQEVCAEWYGCIGDDGTTNNDTPFTLAGAAAVAGGVPLTLGPGVYSWITANSTITIPAGGRFEFRGSGPNTVLKRADATVTADFWSLLIFASSGTGDVEAVSLRDFSIDGGGAENPLPGGDNFEWEHSGDIRFSPISTAAFKVVSVRNVWARDPIADVLWFNTNYSQRVNVENLIVTERNRTRGDITFSYIPQYVKISNCDLTRIDFEPLAQIPGTEAVIQIANCRIEYLDIEGNDDVRLEMTNVDAGNFASTQWIGWWHGGRVRFPSTNTEPRINYPDKFSFVGVDFYFEPDGSGNVESLALHHTASYSSFLTFRNCRFYIDSALAAGSLTAPSAFNIVAQSDSTLDTDREVLFENCWFDSRYSRSLVMDRPGRVRLRNNDYGGQLGAFSWVNGTNFTSHLVVDGGSWDRVAGTFGSLTGGSVAGSLTIRNVTTGDIDFTTLSGITTTFTARSSRRVIVTTTPTGGGIRGEIAQLDLPSASGVVEWVCVTSHVTAATWKDLSTAAA